MGCELMKKQQFDSHADELDNSLNSSAQAVTKLIYYELSVILWIIKYIILGNY